MNAPTKKKKKNSLLEWKMTVSLLFDGSCHKVNGSCHDLSEKLREIN